jgi:hypothetical protein
VVDTDTYTSLVNFPFFATGADGVHEVPRGTPLVQVIPFRRADVAIPHEIRAETKQEAETRTRIFRNTVAASGWYRLHARASR